jgi:hypothetical protein
MNSPEALSISYPLDRITYSAYTVADRSSNTSRAPESSSAVPTLKFTCKYIRVFSVGAAELGRDLDT